MSLHSVLDVKPRLLTLRSRSPSARIFLRSPKKSDTYSINCIVTDPLCIRYMPRYANATTTATMESAYNYIKAWRAASFITRLDLCIELIDRRTRGGEPNQDPQAIIGKSGFGTFNIEDRTADVAMVLASGDVRGKGYAEEAMDMCFAYGFDHLDLETITMSTHKDNEAMKGLAERKFELQPIWREDRQDCFFRADKSWWDRRQSAKGDNKIVVDGFVEEWSEE